MKVEQAWQSVLNQLQIEMPRATFDTWVHDTFVVNFEVDTLIIGTRSAYGRDWLESRISSTVNRMIVGILNRAIKIEFAVAEPPVQETNKEDDEDTDSDIQTNRQGMAIEPMDATYYQREVQPGRVVGFPGYGLRLLTQGDMTPKDMSLWVGFRQAVYSNWKQGKGVVKNIPQWEAARFAMMGRASYFRELAKAQEIGGKLYLAGGMVEIVPVEAANIRNQPTNRSYDNANRYRVQIMPRLTCRDCAVIEKILVANVSECITHEHAHEVVLHVLNDLAVRPPSDYLDNTEVQVNNIWPRNVQEIVRGVLVLEGDMPGDLFKAAENVYDHILNAYGKVSITHYFLEYVVPALGLTHPQAWAIIILRDHCWYDYEAKVEYPYALVDGGLDTLARWVGVTRKAVDGWVYKPEFSTFVRLADLSDLEIPDTWLQKRRAVFVVSQLEPVASMEDIEKVRLDNGKSETRSWKKRDSILEKVRPGLEKVRLDNRKSETRLNNFIKSQLNPFNSINPNQSDGAEDRRARSGGGNLAFWDFDFLTDNNSVTPQKKAALLKSNKTYSRSIAALSQGFVSWLIYAHSPSGKGLEDRTGVSLAVKRPIANPHAGAGHGFDLLAALRPFELKTLFDLDLADHELPDTEVGGAYKTHIGCQSDNEKRDLYLRLFG